MCSLKALVCFKFIFKAVFFLITKMSKRYGEFLYYLERPELITLYDSLILKLFRSNSKFPHPDKKECITRYSRNNFWMVSFMIEVLGTF